MNQDVNGDVERVLAILSEAVRTIRAEFTTIWFPVQIGLIAVAAVIGLGMLLLARRRNLIAVGEKWPPIARQLLAAVLANLGLIVFILVVAAFRGAMLALLPPSNSYLLGVSISLATAWVAISILAALIRNHFVNRVVAISAWTIAALSILGLLKDTTQWLDSVAVIVGGLRLSLLLLIKTAGLLLLTLWAATAASNFIDRRVRSSADLTPSIQVLIAKLIRLTLVTFAILVVLSSVGIDLSVLAIFSGAVGVGVGFGLQRIVSNLVSGIILLADKSIKPGDVITVGDNFGWVDTMGARYTSVVVRDGREILIPNEDLVTQRVINWSHTNERVRLDVDFGVSYASDPHAVRTLAVAAALGVPRVLARPEPVCHLTKFNDFSLDFILRFWIDDPVAGVTNVRGAVMLALWDAFKRDGVEIPFPVRELRLGDTARVVVERPDQAAKPRARG
ncbi:MAG: mechanosensitive ion channel [Alphaproteobacteria bacterium]|nr:mechanosensitive ion channel [Alphaproteobacteria bacterium]